MILGGTAIFGNPACIYCQSSVFEWVVGVFGVFVSGGGDLESPCPVCWSLLCEPVVGGPRLAPTTTETLGGGCLLASFFVAASEENEIRKMSRSR